MKRRNMITAAILSLLLLSAGIPTNKAASQPVPERKADVDRINAAGQAFVAAIAARDIDAMDKLWAHEPHATFIGPLSTT